jgi:hypothetical protein
LISTQGRTPRVVEQLDEAPARRVDVPARQVGGSNGALEGQRRGVLEDRGGGCPLPRAARTHERDGGAPLVRGRGGCDDTSGPFPARR